VDIELIVILNKFVIGYWLLVIGYWLLVIGYWLLVIGYWLCRVSNILITKGIHGIRQVRYL